MLQRRHGDGELSTAADLLCHLLMQAQCLGSDGARIGRLVRLGPVSAPSRVTDSAVSSETGSTRSSSTASRADASA